MNVFSMLVGLPGSGKSNFAKYRQELGFVVVSSDAIREELYGDESVQQDHNKVFQIAHKRIVEALKEDKDVMFDATNLSSKRRMALLNQLPKKPFKQVVVVATPFQEVLRRNLQRERKVPVEVVERMRENFQLPQYWEGWDQILFYWATPREITSFNLEDYNFDQENPNHSLSLSEHLEKVSLLLQHSDILSKAGLLHDIGKRHTKRFQNGKGEPTQEAHYFNHHNVSAYEAMFILRNTFDYFNEDILEIVGLINWHMQPYFLKTEKSVKKFVGKVGEEFWKNLVALNEADKLAKE